MANAQFREFPTMISKSLNNSGQPAGGSASPRPVTNQAADGSGSGGNGVGAPKGFNHSKVVVGERNDDTFCCRHRRKLQNNIYGILYNKVCRFNNKHNFAFLFSQQSKKNADA